jgi:hypothetical protein
MTNSRRLILLSFIVAVLGAWSLTPVPPPSPVLNSSANCPICSTGFFCPTSTEQREQCIAQCMPYTNVCDSCTPGSGCDGSGGGAYWECCA